MGSFPAVGRGGVPGGGLAVWPAQYVDHFAGGALRCSGCSEASGHLFVVGELSLSVFASGQYAPEGGFDLDGGHVVGHEFSDCLAAEHEVDERDVGHFEQVAAQPGDELSAGYVVAHDLWHSEEGGL